MELEAALGEARAAFDNGMTRSLTWRRSQLRSIRCLLLEQQDGALAALNRDVGKHHIEAFRDEVGVLINSVDSALKNLKKWMSPNKVSLPLAFFPSSGEVMLEPLGLVLIFSTWNYPIGLSLGPLIGAISAGNTVVLKVTDLAPASAEFLAYHIPLYLDDKAIKVIQGGPQVAEQLLEHRWDKIFFTGSARIGRIVMTAAAKYLTPVTLELGGKCPAIVDSLSSSRELKMAVERLVGGKWGTCNGQACIGVDYLLVEENFAPVLVDLLKATIKKFYTKPEYISKIINRHHFERLNNLLKDQLVADSIVHGGSRDTESLSIKPTILVNPPLDAEIMTEEIFGPLLPIITLKKIEDSIDFIRARPKPLVIYAFTNNKKLKTRIVEETSSGSVTFNDTLIQYVVESLPFGGVGGSGFGRYHGKFSFDEFSNQKAILRRSFLLDFAFRYPPWSERKLRLLQHVYRFDYIGFVLLLLGLKR